MALTKVSRGLISTSIVDNGNATAITIDSSENVSFTGAATFSGNLGIGTSSPTALIHGMSGDLFLTANSTAANSGQGLFFQSTTSGWATSSAHAAIYGKRTDASNGYLRFDTRQSGTTQEAMRISGGNLLVGKTTDAFGTAGIALRGTVADFTRDGGTPINVNRLTSDGSLIDFHKAGTVVGSIGVAASNYLAIGNNNTSIQFYASGIAPATGSPSALTDNSKNLGSAGFRFKDLYLSGGVYLGGTGAANKLDDYEEGTWTPVIAALGGNIATYTLHGPTYTKVGRLVNVQVYISGININAITAGSYITLQGLPFAATNYADFTIAYKGGDWSTSGNIIGGYVQTGANYAYFMRASGLEAQQTSTDVTMTKAMINITYQAA